MTSNQTNLEENVISTQVKGKHLLIKFLFDSHNDASNHGLVCNSVDKYMSLDVWMKLYEKLGKPIDRYVKNETKQPTEETISMQRAQLDLHISWKKVDALHSAMCDLTPDAVYKYLLLVDVCTYSRVEDFVKKGAKTKSLVNGHAVSLENENLPQSTTVNGSGINDGNGKPNIADTNKRRHEEYVPEASTASPKHSNLRYTPSKNFETDADEYTPTKVIVVDAGTAKCDNIEDGHHYFPSPINNNNHYEFTDSKPYSRGQIKSPRPNKIRMSASKTTMVEPFGHERMPSVDGKATSKANLSQDLFGDSSGSDAEAKEPPAPVIPLRSKPERKAKLVAQKSISSIGALKPSKLSSLASNSAKSSSSGRKALPTPSSSNFAKIFKLQGESVECLVKSPDEKRNDKKGAEKSVEKPKISNEERETEMINKLILEKIANNTLTDSSGKQIGLTCLMWVYLLLVKPFGNNYVIFNFQRFEGSIYRRNSRNI